MKGKLKHWNEDKGFGFISCAEQADIFIHISALKNMSRRPKHGDVISFEIHTDNNGKQRAIKATIEGVAIVETKPFAKHHNNAAQKSRGIMIAASLLCACIIAYAASPHFFTTKFQTLVHSSNDSYQATSYSQNKPKKVKRSENSNFKCEGKQHCSEMRSCAEAKFYITNCPNTKMDGDNDNIPCEKQYCNYKQYLINSLKI